jgi:CheY-like chemotaxis protein
VPDILVVEDNPVNQKLIAYILTRAGYTFDVAEHGAIALEKLTRGKYRLVLMDLMMPVMNGMDATRAIRADPRLSHLPVIAITASAMGGEDQRIRAIGCDDFITKPYAKERVLEAIARLISGRPAAGTAPA